METIFHAKMWFLKGKWRQFCAAGENFEGNIWFLKGNWDNFAAQAKILGIKILDNPRSSSANLLKIRGTDGRGDRWSDTSWYTNVLFDYNVSQCSERYQLNTATFHTGKMLSFKPPRGPNHLVAPQNPETTSWPHAWLSEKHPQKISACGGMARVPKTTSWPPTTVAPQNPETTSWPQRGATGPRRPREDPSP